MNNKKLPFGLKKMIIFTGIVIFLFTFVDLEAKNKKIDVSNPNNITYKPEKANISISKKELEEVAEKIFKNEAGGKKSNLVHWNIGENFPSLGIGHFIWYKDGQRGPFEESLPQLVSYYKSKNIKLPKTLVKNEFSPWLSREELMILKEIKDPDIEELTEFLYNTKDIQIEFIYKRLENSLDKILNSAVDKEKVRKQFYRMANSPKGLYPLIDYVNFKGEGTKPSEGYKGQGWGLLQVLENMKGTELGKSALIEFSDSAKFILQRRVNNSDPTRNEKKWLAGWFKRCDTYKE